MWVVTHNYVTMQYHVPPSGAALVYLPPEYRHKWTPGTQKLGTSKNLTAHHEEQIPNPKLKSLRTELQLVPDVTDSDK